MAGRSFGWMLACAAVLGAACGDDSSSPGDTAGEGDGIAEADGGEEADAEIEEDVPPEAVDGDADVPEEAETVEEADAEADGDATPTVCETYCGPVVDAACSAGPPTLDACLTGCAALVAACGTDFDALATCAGDSPTIVCDASGMPVAEGCETQQAALLGCIAGGPCGSYCEQAVLEGCAMGPATFADCSANCRASELLCATEFDALSTCAGDTFTVECDSLDRVSITDCATEFDALMQCSYVDPCTAVCTPAIAAGCSSGPPDMTSCLGGCLDFAGRGCVPELHDLQDCAGVAPTATCSASDMPVITGCEAETAAFSVCGAP